MAQAMSRRTTNPTGRRTQAERSALTRAKVIEAVIDLVAEAGIASATASRIAQRAGVTWGAIAHQFGDKDAVLLAVVESSFASLSQSLLDALDGSETPKERVSLLIDETWRRIIEPSSQAFVEIVLNARTLSQGPLESRQEALMVAHSQKIWCELFAGFGADPRAIGTARKLTFAALLGMSIQRKMSPRRTRFTREIETLKQLALSMLGLD
jgi:AcrR family transcriptional regulator